MNIKDIIKKIKNREYLEDNELNYIIKTYSIYTEKEYKDNNYYYISTLCKLDNIYIIINWDKSLNKKLKTKYYQPIRVTKIKTKYLHIITLEDNSSCAITINKKLI